MAEDFRGPFLKVYRAKTHIEELHRMFTRFIQAQSYKAIANFILEPGNIVWIARGEDLFPHDEFSPIVGDAIQNLRSSLDLAVSVLMRNAGFADFEGYFPTGDSLNHLRNAIGKGTKNKSFPSNLVKVLENRIQPYEGGDGRCSESCIIFLSWTSIGCSSQRSSAPSIFG